MKQLDLFPSKARFSIFSIGERWTITEKRVIRGFIPPDVMMLDSAETNKEIIFLHEDIERLKEVARSLETKIKEYRERLPK